MTQRKTSLPPVRTLFVCALSLAHLQESTAIAVLRKTVREQSPGTAAASAQEEQKRSPTHPEEKMVQSAHASLGLSPMLKEKEQQLATHRLPLSWRKSLSPRVLKTPGTWSLDIDHPVPQPGPKGSCSLETLRSHLASLPFPQLSCQNGHPLLFSHHAPVAGPCSRSCITLVLPSRTS